MRELRNVKCTGLGAEDLFHAHLLQHLREADLVERVPVRALSGQVPPEVLVPRADLLRPSATHQQKDHRVSVYTAQHCSPRSPSLDS